jgi:hypothetical protein
MPDNNNAQWSSKFKKFGITDPFLKLVTVKYENSILTWGTVVKDELTLNQHIKDVLLPDLKKKTIWNEAYNQSAKSLFVGYDHLDVEQILKTDEFTDDELIDVSVHLSDLDNYNEFVETGQINCSLEQYTIDCMEFAAYALATIINNRKEDAFKIWFDNVQKKHPKNVAFQYLILKPIIEQSGYNSRRLLPEPDNGVLKWLFVRIQHEFYLPSTNFGLEYRMRLSNGLNHRVINGWQFIPSGVENAAKLTAAAARSGWCVAGQYYAKYYLYLCDFYILREKGKPVVALRVDKNEQKFHEIRGVNNGIPNNYYSEIWFFISSIFSSYTEPRMIENGVSFEYEEMLPSFSRVVNTSIENNKNNREWWQEMVSKWPGTYDLVPDELQSKVKLDTSNFIKNQFYMSLGVEFREKYGINFSESDYIGLLEQHPQLYYELGVQDNPTLNAACIKGVLNRLIVNDITYKEYSKLPEFVRKSPEIINRITTHLPLSFEKNIIKRGSNYKERNKSVKLEEHVPYTQGESLDLTILRALESILKNQSSDFTDVIFSEDILSHPDFKEIRKQAWLRAVLKDPTFYFAFPIDLIHEHIWAPQTKINVKDEKTLETWISRIESRPWYLSTEGKVPKSVRYHEALLRAYLKGWGAILSKTPSQIWKKPNSYQRVYMSYAALRNFYIFSVLAKSFGKRGGGFSTASERMRQIPSYQLAFFWSAIINFMPNSSVRNLIKPIIKPTTKGIVIDPQYELIKLFLSKGFNEFLYLSITKPDPENYYFNRIDPGVPIVEKIHIGSLVELEVDGQIKQISIGLNTPGFEFIEKDSAKAKLLFSRKEGEIVPGHKIKIIKIF